LEYPTRADLAAKITEFPDEQVDAAIDNLVSLGQVKERADGGLVVSVNRKTIRDTSGLLDALGDL
jgi:hypothetical protein